jgi:hypothetical protein
MYLSHPVRRIREEPLPDESITLVVELEADADPETFQERVTEIGGTVDEDLRFSWRVTVPQTALDDLLSVSGLERVETANTISLGLERDDREE